MRTTRLTTKFVETVKPTPGAQVAYPDAQVPGLELRVSPQGRKVWSLRYRTLAGRQRRMTLGVFPAVDLGDARDKAMQALAVVAGGGDPASEKRRAAQEARNLKIRTFNDLADAYMEACEAGEWKPKGKRKRDRTLRDERSILNRNVRPVIGKLELEEIDRATVKKLLRGMVARKIGAQTNRTQAVIRQVFAFGIAEERVAVNPATGFAPLADEKPRVRVLSDSELALWWTTLAAWPGDLRAPSGDRVTVSRSVRIALQLATLLLQRRNEIAGMALSELNLEQGVWLIPGERMKNGLPHLVPLPPRAVELIGEALTLARDGRKDAPPHVFPSTHRAGPIHPDSLTHAMRDITQALGLAGVTPHDLRRTGSTALTSERIGVSPFIRSQVLGHRSDAGGGSAVSLAHYDANSYASEKRRALEAWENLLLTITGEREAHDNLIRLGSARG